MPEYYHSDIHGDIDLLVSSPPLDVAYLINATPVYTTKHRVHYKININNETVRFDLRHVGDEYYDINWQKSIIETRVLQNNFYIPNDDNHKYSLLYHVLIHKPKISLDYDEILQTMGFSKLRYFEELQMFLEKRGYQITEPIDLSVYFNTELTNKRASFKRLVFSFICKIAGKLKQYISPVMKSRARHVLNKYI